jgi:hypothetical protein
MGWQDGTPVENTEQPAWMRGTPVNSAPSSADPRLAGIPNAFAPANSQPTQSSNTDVLANSLWKGAANVGDTVLNAPQNILNLGRAAVGTGLGAIGRPDLAPEITQNPDFARRGLESMRFIRPEIVPQGALQNTIDILGQGAIGGALTGGGGLWNTIAGAGMGALSSGAAAGTEKLTGNQTAGMAAGILAPAAVAKLGGGLSNVRPDVKALLDEGVKLTPGQTAGGFIQRIEDAFTSIPIAGDVVRAAQRRGIISFDTAALNRALSPVGMELPKGLKGHDAVGYVQDTLGAKYDSLRAKMRGSLDGASGATQPGTGVSNIGTPNAPAIAGTQAQTSPTLRSELQNILAMGNNLPPPQRAQLKAIIQNEVINRFTSSGLASGETIKNIESKLGKLAASQSRSENYDVRNLGDAVKEAQAALRRMVEVENPQHAAELAKINEGYANFKTIQEAAASVAAKDGVFTPAQLHRAAKNADYSKDKSRFARGDALMQDLTGAGKNVLSSSVPDSGTATRALLEALALGAGGHFINPTAGAVGLGAMSLYSPWGQNALNAMMTGKQGPLMAQAAANSTIPLSGIYGARLSDLQRKQGQQQ